MRTPTLISLNSEISCTDHKITAIYRDIVCAAARSFAWTYQRFAIGSQITRLLEHKSHA